MYGLKSPSTYTNIYFQSAFKRPEDTFRALFKPLLHYKMGTIMALHTSTSTKSHNKMLLKDFLLHHLCTCKANCRRHLNIGESFFSEPCLWSPYYTYTLVGVPRVVVVFGFHHRRWRLLRSRLNTRQICQIYCYVSLGWSHNMNMAMHNGRLPMAGPENYDVRINDIFIWPTMLHLIPLPCSASRSPHTWLINTKLFDVFLHTKEILYNIISYLPQWKGLPKKKKKLPKFGMLWCLDFRVSVFTKWLNGYCIDMNMYRAVVNGNK